MASSAEEKEYQKNEGPTHEVCLKDFWMSKYEITQGQWKSIFDENQAYFKKGDNYPIESVSWDDVQKFLVKLNKKSEKKYRLPTEAEWEYACRAGGSDKYCGGNEPDRLSWHSDNSDESTHPVGKKEKNRFGLYDMSGNVWEWCADWYGEDYYHSSPKNDPTGPSSGTERVVRGGSWKNMVNNIRVMNRNWNSPDFRLIFA